MDWIFSEKGNFILTTLAILFGPIIAVYLTELRAKKRSDKDRQLHVFRSLMATRRSRLSNEHVQALNLVEIEFSSQKNVLNSYNNLISFFGDGKWWNVPNPSDQDLQNRSNKHDDLLVDLLSKMARCLGYNNFGELSILRGGYFPALHVDNQQDVLDFQKLMGDIARGDRMFPVFGMDKDIDKVNSSTIPKSKDLKND